MWSNSLAARLIAITLWLSATNGSAETSNTLAEHGWRVPGWSEIVNVLLLKDYNTRVVALGTMMLGLAAGVVGPFMLLRKRALAADAMSHATLPGICVAFLIMVAAGGSGKWLPGLLLGAAVSGVLGMLVVLAIRDGTRIKEDTALGIVLSSFFGLGIALLGVIQKTSAGNVAGLESFIYGKTASMLASDAYLMSGAALLSFLVAALFFKEFSLVCFDDDFSQSLGWSVRFLDILMILLTVAVAIVGLQAVGLILIIAFLIIPPAAARFWTHRIRSMVAISALIGGWSGLTGAALSALQPGLPAGAVIVLVTGLAFAISLFFGRARGVFWRAWEFRQLSRKISQQHLLRALYEHAEQGHEERELTVEQAKVRSANLRQLLHARSWSGRELRRALRQSMDERLIVEPRGGEFYLSERGLREATRVVTNHRLWEIYLITHADIAPSHVDRDADQIEHVIGTRMVEELKALLRAEQLAHAHAVPPSPHKLLELPSSLKSANSTP